MTKMSKTQRIAILDFHNGVTAKGHTFTADSRTIAALQRNGWAWSPEGTRLRQQFPPRSAYVTTAGLIAAGVDMDAIYAEAVTEGRRRAVAAARQGRPEALDGTLGGPEMVLAVLPAAIEQAHGEALDEKRDRERTEARERSYAETDARKAASVEPVRLTHRLEDMRDAGLRKTCTALGIRGTSHMGHAELLERLHQAERDGRLVQPDETPEPAAALAERVKAEAVRHAEAEREALREAEERRQAERFRRAEVRERARKLTTGILQMSWRTTTTRTRADRKWKAGEEEAGERLDRLASWQDKAHTRLTWALQDIVIAELEREEDQ